MRRSASLVRNEIRVAVLILVALGVFGVAIFKLGTSARLFARRYTLIAFFADANGLREGGPVTVAGQVAGSIRSIQFLPVDTDTTKNLKVVLELDEQIRQQVRADSRVILRNQGLLGDKSVDITPGTPRFRALRDGDTLVAGPSVDYEAMIRQAASALRDVVALTHDMRQVTGALVRGEGTMGRLLTHREIYDQFNQVLVRTGAVLGRLQNPNGSVGRLLDDPSLYYNLMHAVASIDTLVTELHTGNGTAAKLLRDDTLYANLTRVTARADSFVTAMTHANGTASKLMTDSQLYDQLVQAVSHLNEILVDIRRNPKRYTKGAVKLF